MMANDLWSSLFLIGGGHVHKHHPWDGEMALATIFIIVAMAVNIKIKNRILKWTITTLASLCALFFIIIMIINY
jgi:hypothetical protein